MDNLSLFLKRLELSGFKSFAGKTVLEFPTGIVAIVGPNGSGKSNIVDALRWVMGEREARYLRSAKLENLIFAGTPKRPAVGMAQVALHFNNRSRFLPLDFEEVVISRKADRSGSSEYYVNNSEVRLKDLIGILAQGRLGSRGLLIVNQGDSDILIKSLPAERRSMIEEIIGLRQYQIKKGEAERKLVSTGLNLDKTRAMVEEIKPHLRFLRRQTGRYQRRSEIEEELRLSEDRYLGTKQASFEAELASVQPRLDQLEKSLSERRKEFQGLESEFKKTENQSPSRHSLNEIRREHEKIRSEQSRVQKEIGRLEGRLEVMAVHVSASDASKTLNFSKKEAEKLLQKIKTSFQSWLQESDLSRLKNEIKVLSRELDDLFAVRSNAAGPEKDDYRKLTEEKDRLVRELNKFDGLIKELLEKETVFAAQFEGFNAEFRKRFEALESCRSVMSKLENDKNHLFLERERVDFRRQDLERQAREWGRELDKLQITNYKLQNAGEVDLPGLEKKIFKLRGELAAIGEIDEASLKEAQETEARYDFLTGQMEDLEKASVDLKGLIKELAQKIDTEFRSNLHAINEEFNKYFRLMFGGGKAKFAIQKIKIKEEADREGKGGEGEEGEKEERTDAGDERVQDESEEIKEAGLEIELTLPKKKLKGLDALSGGERSLVSLAALFALIAIKPPPFLILDEIDAALDEVNAKRFANLLREFSSKTQFVIVTHNRATMEVADVLYGVTMGDDGVSRVLSLKLES